jgi:hypothetical protein
MMIFFAGRGENERANDPVSEQPDYSDHGKAGYPDAGLRRFRDVDAVRCA